MSKKRIMIWFSIISFLVLGYLLFPPVVGDVYLGTEFREGELVNPVLEFSPETDEIHSFVPIYLAKGDTELKVVFLQEDLDYEIASFSPDLKRGNNKILTSIAKPDLGWEKGQYEVRYYLNQEVEPAKNQKFLIK